MFNLKSSRFGDFKQVLEIYTQEEVFFDLLGYFPEQNKYYKSPFRKDSSPGCRFEKSQFWLYFIDNAGINGKIKFNCFEMGSILTGLPIEEFCFNLLLNKRKNNLNFKTIDSAIPFRADIRIETETWNENDYFSRFEIPISLLEKACVLKVKNYWINSKSNPKLIKNKYGKFKHQIAYYFPESNHIKLYFPEETKYKWFSNMDVNDVFNWEIKDLIDLDEIFLTKSGKDALILQHHLQIPSIALLNEQCKVPLKVIDYLKHKKITIVYDNDSVGIENSIRIENQLKNEKVNDVSRRYTRLKDAGDSYPRFW